MSQVNAPTLTRHTISDDRRSVTTWWDFDHVIVESKVGWAQPVTAEQLAYVLTKPPPAQNCEAGLRNRIRKLGPLAVGVSTGPPTWWFPRVQFKRWQLCVGWLRCSVHVLGWHRG